MKNLEQFVQNAIAAKRQEGRDTQRLANLFTARLMDWVKDEYGLDLTGDCKVAFHEDSGFVTTMIMLNDGGKLELSGLRMAKCQGGIEITAIPAKILAFPYDSEFTLRFEVNDVLEDVFEYPADQDGFTRAILHLTTEPSDLLHEELCNHKPTGYNLGKFTGLGCSICAWEGNHETS